MAEAIAGLAARHAPSARRFLTAWSGIQIRPLLRAARLRRGDGAMGIFPGPIQHRDMLALLPQDPLLHLRIRPPQPDLAGTLRALADDGVRAGVVLLTGPLGLAAATAAPALIDPGGMLLLANVGAEAAGRLATTFDLLAVQDGLVALRPRRFAAPLPQAEGRRAIIVVIVGAQIEAEWAITGHGIRAYAEAIGAELRLVRDAGALPLPLVKAAAAEVAAEYDRFILLDTDIVLRPHCPDLFAVVPPGSVGVFPEGSRTDRTALTAEATAMFGGPAFAPADYFNAGMMVLSRAHHHLLRDLGRGISAGSLIEQNLINVAVRRGGHPIRFLPPEFNFIPGNGVPGDWRCGWMLHLAGSPKPAFRSRTLWDRHAHDGGIVWSERPLRGRQLRLPHLTAQAERITGQEVLVLDPEDLDYARPFAMPRLTPDGFAAIWVEPAAVGGPAHRAHGAFADVAPGVWRLRFLPLPGAALPALPFIVTHGNEAVLHEGRMDHAPDLMLDLPEATAALRVTILPGDAAAGLVGILLSRPAPGVPLP